MSEDTLILLTVYTFCALVYAAAFTVAYIKSQNMTVYAVLFVIQLLFLLYELSGYKSSGSSDAAGSGMAEGYFHLLLLSIQVILSLTVLIIMLVRVSSVLFWKRCGLVFALIATLITVYKLYARYKDRENETIYYREEISDTITGDVGIVDMKKSRELDEKFVKIEHFLTESGFELDTVNEYKWGGAYYLKNKIYYKIVILTYDESLVISRAKNYDNACNNLFEDEATFSFADEDGLLENVRNYLQK